MNVEEIDLVYKARCKPKEREKTCNGCDVKIPINEGQFTVHMKFYCAECSLLITNLHIPYYVIEKNQVIEKVDYENTREKLIDFIYCLCDQKLQKKLFTQIQQFQKKYSFIDMIRAMEYHHVIKRIPIKEEYKGSIGIVPYVMEDSKKYYNQLIRENRSKAERQLRELQKVKPSLLDRIRDGVDSL